MYYLLDGNNILKSTPEFLGLADGNFTMAQHELVVHTAKVMGSKNKEVFIAVFFDGTGINYKFRPPLNAKVIFGKGKSADVFIIEEIKRMHDLRMQGKDTGEVVVISDDREIRESAKIFGAISWRTGEFVTKLFPRARNKLPPRSKTIEKNITFINQEKITEELGKYYKNKGKI